jgi:hypothetical protein
MEHYREWAEEISSSFLNSGYTPTDTLSKIAQSEELEPFQIEILAAEANKTIHAHKYASMDEKYFAADFPLANAKEVIRCLQGGTTKVAGAFVDPIIPQADGPDAYDMFGIKPEKMDKTASVKHQLKVAKEKTDLLSQKIDDEIFMKTAAVETGEKNFIKTARSIVLEGYNSDERMKSLGYIYHFTKQAGYPVAGKRMLAKLAFVLSKEGMLEPRHAKVAMEYFTKKADLVAPPELISQDLNVQIVNGTHPLYITLKTVGDNEADLLRWNRDSDFVQDKVRILKQKIRAL